MPLNGMRNFVESRTKPQQPEPSKQPKQALTKDRARELGFYLDPNQPTEKTVNPSKKVSLQPVHRTFSPSLSAGDSSRDDAPRADHNAFDTDASLHDGLSSCNDEDTVEVLQEMSAPEHRSRFSPSMHDNTTNNPPPSTQLRVPHDRPIHKNKELSPFELRDLARGRRPTPSSYPETTTDGSQGANDQPASRSSREVDDLREWRTAYPAPAPRPVTNDISSARATAASSTAAASSMPAARGGPRLTIVREPLVVRETVIAEPTPIGSRVQDSSADRPKTSRGLQTQHINTVVETPEGVGLQLPIHQIAKSSTLGEVSDPESSPSPPDTDVLDYTPEQLSAMRYSELRSEEVDAPHSLPMGPIHSDTDLAVRLTQALHSSDAAQQRALLESLSLHSWEDAGDWFVARLADIIKRSVELRKDKRRLALELENEIESRHDLIHEKRQVLEENLKGLREAGGRVLEVGTPMKKKKARKA
ncbi:hypothetical protein K461DRAFT_266355 [Myriangium duriaei CBS 260.36]|uniref:Extracellular mutant protein 11 C-terminal domain-containing protein n=1 Tax=Myriangium duriaei CBS 260.36 TaxID=1168546 RepID=A0A9P4J4Q3_9PEZI|nr:hypothetical protein K461DRAFT_266355 [Myriangium duriaei CBS 260.36]